MAERLTEETTEWGCCERIALDFGSDVEVRGGLSTNYYSSLQLDLGLPNGNVLAVGWEPEYQPKCGQYVFTEFRDDRNAPGFRWWSQQHVGRDLRVVVALLVERVQDVRERMSDEAADRAALVKRVEELEGELKSRTRTVDVPEWIQQRISEGIRRGLAAKALAGETP